MSADNVTSVYLKHVALSDSPSPGQPGQDAALPEFPATGDAALDWAMAAILAMTVAMATIALMLAGRGRRTKASRRRPVPRRRAGLTRGDTRGILPAIIAAIAVVVLSASACVAAPAFAAPTEDAAGSGSAKSEFIPTPPELREEPGGAAVSKLSSRAIPWTYPESGVYRIDNTYRTANLVGRNTADDYAYVYLGVGDGDCYFYIEKQSDGWYTIKAMHNGTYLKAWESSTGVFGNPGTWFVDYLSTYSYWAFQEGGYGGGLGISNKYWGSGNYLDIVGTHDGYYDNRVNLSSYAGCPDASGRGWRLEEIPFDASIALSGKAETGSALTASLTVRSFNAGNVICRWYAGDAPGAATTLLAEHTVASNSDSLTIPAGIEGKYITCIVSDDEYRGSFSATTGPVKSPIRISLEATPEIKGRVSGDGDTAFPPIKLTNTSNCAVSIASVSMIRNRGIPWCALSIGCNGAHLFDVDPKGCIQTGPPLVIPAGGVAEISVDASGPWLTDGYTTLVDFIESGYTDSVFILSFSARRYEP